MLCTLCGALFLPQNGGTNVCSNSSCPTNFSEERCPACHQMVDSVAIISETDTMLRCNKEHEWLIGSTEVGTTIYRTS